MRSKSAGPGDLCIKKYYGILQFRITLACVPVIPLGYVYAGLMGEKPKMVKISGFGGGFRFRF